MSSSCDALRDLAPFVQFKKREKHPRSNFTFSKSITPPRFSRFLNCTIGTKRTKYHIYYETSLRKQITALSKKFYHKSLVIRQKGEFRNGGNKKTKQKIRNVRFSKNLICFVVLLPPSWDLPFRHITGKMFDGIQNTSLNFYSKCWNDTFLIKIAPIFDSLLKHSLCTILFHNTYISLYISVKLPPD